MKGQPEVIKELNAALHAELTAIVQYMVQAEMCQNWGYARLGDEIKKQAYAKVATARFAIEKTGSYPDATFTLRLAYGLVRGYDEDAFRVEQVGTFVYFCSLPGHQLAGMQGMAVRHGLDRGIAHVQSGRIADGRACHRDGGGRRYGLPVTAGNQVGVEGALKRYGSGVKAKFNPERV